ncbi:MAG TPA: undecaprenyldiphospho-muramoylpentapeptide beta-N-acetylglucosaminyltransferase [Kofleriaceae bacterium]|nr:undecaprenyldiphospho-muramoylpentapeptide beta-N-acetylglucosaminyltransferase [Kofleriaceae bacterium]
MTALKPLRVMIAGGGTGGHLFPGIAIAEEVRQAHPDAQIRFVGTTRGIEARVLPQLGWDHDFIEVSGLKTVGVVGALRGMLRLPKALWQARRVVKAFAPDAVVGVGGYASGPVVLMAKLRGVKTAICEQNSIPGLTNKILGKLVQRVFLAFDVTRPFFKAKKVALVGTPIRVAMLKRLVESTAAATTSTGLVERKPLRIFICGGSLGAVKLNEVASEAVIYLSENRTVHVVHQTGKQGLAETEARYRNAGLGADRVECREFIDDMAAQYAAADLIIARAGAATVAELAIAGKPAIFVPYPFAADNHQELNAKEIVDGGGAKMFRQAQLTGDILRAAILDIVDDPAVQQRMAANMAGFAKPGAGRAVAEWCAAR